MKQQPRRPAGPGAAAQQALDHAAAALAVTARLTALYGPARWSSKDPLTMLVDIILSHRTRNEQTVVAYRALEDRFGSREEDDGPAPA